MSRIGNYPAETVRTADRGNLSELRQMQEAEREAARQQKIRAEQKEAVKMAREQTEIVTSPTKLLALMGQYDTDPNGTQSETDALAEINKFRNQNPEYVATTNNARVMMQILKETLSPPAKITASNLNQLFIILSRMHRLETKPVESQTTQVEPQRQRKVSWASEPNPVERPRDSQGRFVSEVPKVPKLSEMTSPNADLMIGWDLNELKQGRKKLITYSPMAEAVLTAEQYRIAYGLSKVRSTMAPMEVFRSGDR